MNERIGLMSALVNGGPGILSSSLKSSKFVLLHQSSNFKLFLRHFIQIDSNLLVQLVSKGASYTFKAGLAVIIF